MKNRTRAIATTLLFLVLVVALWILLVVAGVHRPLQALVHPRVYARSLGATVILVILASWRLWSVIRTFPDRFTGAGTPHPFAALLPLVFVLLLVPAAVRDLRVNSIQPALLEGGRLQTVPSGSSNPERQAHLEHLLAGSDQIVIDDDNYARVVDLIWRSPSRFAGRTVEVVAFVYRDAGWSSNYVTAARLSIWCCLVDAAVIGLLAETDPWNQPRENDWIRVRGELGVLDTFNTGAITMTDVPVLRDVTWENVAAPSFEYVFPADW